MAEYDRKMSLGAHRALIVLVVVVPALAAVWAVVWLGVGLTSWWDVALMGFFYGGVALGVTVGYHRMLTHGSFRAHPLVKAPLLILGTWSLEGAPLTWAATHLKHHRYSDRDDDPHSPLRGFLHAHVGWLFDRHRVDPKVYAPAQAHDPVTVFIDRTALLWVILGLWLPFYLGGWSGFLWAGLVRVFLVQHVTWSVNSICHTFGTQAFNRGRDRSTNNWVIALLALGEGWHNNHHAFPKSAFHGLGWRQLDVSGLFIRLLGLLGLARDIYSVPGHVVRAQRTRHAHATT